ncbi:MAG: GspE/PulE family protein [Patescibacteria group bacterium]
MKDQDLIQSLTGVGLLAKEVGDKLLKDAQTEKKSVEAIIYDRRLVDETELAKVKSKILGIPYKKIDSEIIAKDILEIIPPETANRYKIIPLSRSKDMIVVGALYPDDLGVKEALRFLGKQQKANVGVFLVTPSDITAVLSKYSGFQDEIQAALQAVKPFKQADRRIVKLEPEVAIAEEAPIIKLVSTMLKEAVAGNASDLHIEPQQDRLRVRFRIEGELREVSSLPIDLHKPIISRIKVLSNLKIDETRIPQDGRFRTIILDREIDFRVATFPTPAGEKAALRVLDPKVGLRSLDDLGLIGQNSEAIKEAIGKPYGMIVLTGPTGSGKTTTLYAVMQILNKEGVNIVSLEDPVEYSISGINQSQIKPEIGYDFASGLRQILRQDPDVIMVGEIRDSETAELAVHAALTGHIVLTTLHTNNSVSSIPRLIDLGVKPFLLPSALSLMAAQRLVPKLCQDCKKSMSPSPEISEIIKDEISRLPADLRDKYKAPYKVYKAEGCVKCKKKGIVGRVAIFEAFKMTPQLTEIINIGVTENKLLEEAKRQNMVTLRQDGIIKALEGKIGIEEVLRETSEV